MLRWYEGFEQYGNGQDALITEGLWLSNFNHVSNLRARTGTLAMSTNAAAGGYARRSLGRDCSTVGVGSGFWMDSLPVTVDAAVGGAARTCIIQVMDKNLVTHVWVTAGTTGRLQVWCDAITPRLLAESILEIVAGTWNHIELKVVLSATVGVIKLYVNGQQWVNLTAQNTIASTATNFGAQVGFGTPGGAGIWSAAFLLWDDIFTYDEQAGINDILGEYGVYQLLPISDDGTHHDWSLTFGANGYALINEVPPDDATNFIFTDTVNNRSDFGVGPLPSNIVSVAAVMPCGRLQKTDTGDCNIELGVNSAGTASYSGSTPITTSWTYFEPIVFETDPHTGSAWTVIGADAAKLSVKRV